MEPLRRMLEARSVAVVGASDRAGSFGSRLVTEALRSPAYEKVHLIHPKHATLRGRPCLPSLADLPEPVDLVLLGVPDAAVVDQVAAAAQRGDGGAVVFGSMAGRGEELRSAAGLMPVCGAGCMGFVNTVAGVRAIGYLERDPLPSGPVALVTHSGSVFSALLRTHRRLEYSLAVSSGQELVTTTADYLDYALELPQTRVVALFLETVRDPAALRRCLARAADRDIPVVAVAVGGSTLGSRLVTAHSGAIAGADAGWEALFDAYAVHRAASLDELVDTVEAFGIGRRLPAGRPVNGIATVHDSGAERVLVADVAAAFGVPFAPLSEQTKRRLAGLLGEGLAPDNPLDVWGTGADTRELFTSCMQALADDPAVDIVVLAIDLVPEYDGDDSYPEAALTVHVGTDKPVVVLANVAAAVDQRAAVRLRAAGIPVLEGSVPGVRSLSHLLADAETVEPVKPVVDTDRRSRWLARLSHRLSPLESLDLLADYGLSVAASRVAGSFEEALVAATAIGYPVALKTAAPGADHKTDVEGVLLGVADETALEAAYRSLADRLGAAVLVQRQVAAGVELALGIVRDPTMGPLLVLAAGGTLVEVIRQRRVALPPVGRAGAERMLAAKELAELVAGARGSQPVNAVAILDAIQAMSQLAVELGDAIDALDVNPLIAGAREVVAVDALVVSRPAVATGRQ